MFQIKCNILRTTDGNLILCSVSSFWSVSPNLYNSINHAPLPKFWLFWRRPNNHNVCSSVFKHTNCYFTIKHQTKTESFEIHKSRRFQHFSETFLRQIILDPSPCTFFSLDWSSWDAGVDIDIEEFTLRKVGQCIVRFANRVLALKVVWGTNVFKSIQENMKAPLLGNTFDSWHWHWEV